MTVTHVQFPALEVTYTCVHGRTHKHTQHTTQTQTHNTHTLKLFSYMHRDRDVSRCS